VKSLALQLVDKFGDHISAKLLILGNFREWEVGLISLKTFPIAGSSTQDIRNQGVEFRASLLFSWPTIYLKYIPLLAIMRYSGDTKSPLPHLLEQDNTLLLLYFAHIHASVWHAK